LELGNFLLLVHFIPNSGACSDSGPLSHRAAIAKIRYRKDLHMQNSIRKLKLTLTLTVTLTDTGGAVLTLMLGYRSLYITWQ